jgi:hypothetical protein
MLVELADQLTRHELAASLRMVVLDAAEPPARLLPMPVCYASVLSSREGILGLAERLEGARPANAAGLDRVRALLAELTRPRHNPAPPESVGRMLWWVADGLQVCPPHRWWCPVLMKLDPEHIAWTCSYCGAIALGDDLTTGPA